MLTNSINGIGFKEIYVKKDTFSKKQEQLIYNIRKELLSEKHADKNSRNLIDAIKEDKNQDIIIIKNNDDSVDVNVVKNIKLAGNGNYKAESYYNLGNYNSHNYKDISGDLKLINSKNVYLSQAIGFLMVVLSAFCLSSIVTKCKSQNYDKYKQCVEKMTILNNIKSTIKPFKI